MLVKIMTSCKTQKESKIDLKINHEHPAGVAPPCRPPPAGCSEFPIHAVHHRTAPTGFMEFGHVP